MNSDWLVLFGPTEIPIQWVELSVSPGAKGPWCQSDHSPPTISEAKKKWIYISTPPQVFMAWFLISWAYWHLYFLYFKLAKLSFTAWHQTRLSSLHEFLSVLWTLNLCCSFCLVFLRTALLTATHHIMSTLCSVCMKLGNHGETRYVCKRRCTMLQTKRSVYLYA